MVKKDMHCDKVINKKIFFSLKKPPTIKGLANNIDLTYFSQIKDKSSDYLPNMKLDIFLSMRTFSLYHKI